MACALEARWSAATVHHPKREGRLCERNDFASAERGAVLKHLDKTRITTLLDQDVVDSFRKRAKDTGRGYQTASNQALREYLASDDLEATLRRVVREDIRNAV